MSYETRRDPNKPWGYWLFATDDRFKVGGLRDENGATWPSVRHAFWCGRLGMDLAGTPESMNRGLEFLLGVLTIMRARQIRSREAVQDIFGGSLEFEDFYGEWLFSVGLTDSPSCRINASLTVEGHAVLRMLMVTRSTRFGFVPIGLETLRALAEPKRNRTETEAWFRKAEAVSAKLPYRFVRQDIASEFAVVLVGRDLGDGIPVGRTLWSQAFAEEETRDGFYRWLCMRMERWETWGDGAYRKGASSLTQHLLAIVAAGMPSLTEAENM